MAASAGRKVLFYWKEITDTEWTPATGVKEKSLSINNAAIDITTDDDDGWKTSLDDTSAQRDWSLEISGVKKDNQLIARALEEGSLDIYYRDPDKFHLTGRARITSCKESAAGEDPVTYDVSFEGSGEATTGAGTAPA